jgi:hypothetical protein
MTVLSLAEMLRDQACIGQLALAKYKADTAREICAANAPKLLRVIETVKKALEDEK